ncbi:MAG: TRAM domain-containing protein [Chloroflexota bacterium]
MLADLRLDKTHLARYSPRPGTVSARRMADDVSDAEKRRRFHLIEALNEQVSLEKMQRWLGETVEVLVEDKHKGKWRGRTPHNKLVFFDDPRPLRGELVQVKISHAGAWSLSGTAVDTPTDESISIPLGMM